ncbi:hypothetical protein [Brucella intermedia]|nr:hypothetical protein [Brucella intermedia]WGG60742.1 hypothetical protein QA414_06235 [Brucella intermedia]WGJ07990.1 hypothetical protein QBQ48_04310 [Brucella intermedia]
MMRQPITRYMAEKDAVYGEAFRLWRQGKDTLEIGRIMGISEADAHRRVHTMISHENRRPARFVKHGTLS